MSDDQPEQQARSLAEDERRRLANDAASALRLLAEALVQPDDSSGSPSDTDAVALLARLHAAVEPLREVAESLGGQGALSLQDTPGAAHGSPVHEPPQGQDSRDRVNQVIQPLPITSEAAVPAPTVRVTASLSTSWDVAATVTATRSTSWNVAATEDAEDGNGKLTLGPEDVPWLLWQILLRLDDSANPMDSRLTYGEVYNSVVATLGLLVSLLALLNGS